MDDTPKPIVKYRLDGDHSVTMGLPAFVEPIDHPHTSNTGLVRTSKVIKIVGGTFETLNTKYIGVRGE